MAPGADIARDARMPRFIGGPPDPSQRFAASAAVLVGAGSVGLRAAIHLARLAIGRLWIVDPGVLGPTSLLTHPVVPAAADAGPASESRAPVEVTWIGEAKARHAARRVAAISPATRVQTFAGRFEDLSFDASTAAIGAADVVLLATDNLGVELALGQACLRLGTPLLQASVHGDTLVAQVRRFMNGRGGGRGGAGDDGSGGGRGAVGHDRRTAAHGPVTGAHPVAVRNEEPGGQVPDACPACLFGDEEWRQLARETRYSCSGDGAGAVPGAPAAAARRTASMPTMSTSFLCSLAADLLLVEVTRLLLGLGAPPADALIEYCGYTHRTTLSPLRRSTACRCEHVRWRRVSSLRPLGASTTEELAAAAGVSRPFSIVVGDHCYCERPACGCSPCDARFVATRPAGAETDADREAARCERCGVPMRPATFDSYHEVPGELLLAQGGRSLAELGVGHARYVLLRDATRCVLVADPGSDDGSHRSEHDLWSAGWTDGWTADPSPGRTRGRTPGPATRPARSTT
jgi:molybdopterin/thiamine biosynthesis adenylyltransferase